MKTEERINGFVEEIWSWYGRHKRQLPWRDLTIEDDTQRAYVILVSEIMLQQTQVSRVIVIFKRFLLQFPTLTDLANASNKEVILAWKGMGYNSRALRLRDVAKTIVETYQGIFPKEMDELLSLKGIGPYTAAAIRNFAFNLPTPCIDTNIRRILERTFVGLGAGNQGSATRQNGHQSGQVRDRELLKIANRVLEKALLKAKNQKRNAAADWHAALMDFGSLVHTKSNPRWDICPLTEKNLMKVTREKFEANLKNQKRKTNNNKQEPGRMMGAKYIPNRIFRGRIIDALREHHLGLTVDQIGSQICIDWAPEHLPWLRGLLAKLQTDALIATAGERFVLSE